jgi:hypothetical protein
MFKVKNKVAYFGLEYDHNKVPNAIVIASARPQKVIKWVNAYKPVVIEQEDGTKVRRERTAVQCPPGFRLRKDEIRAAMKRNKTESWQDGKFFVILDHRMGQFEHPDTVNMKKAELRKKVEDEKREQQLADEVNAKVTTPPPSEVQDSDPSKPVGVGEADSNTVAVQGGPSVNPEPVKSTTESGVEVTDRRRGAGVEDSKEQIV